MKFLCIKYVFECNTNVPLHDHLLVILAPARAHYLYLRNSSYKFWVINLFTDSKLIQSWPKVITIVFGIYSIIPYPSIYYEHTIYSTALPSGYLFRKRSHTKFHVLPYSNSIFIPSNKLSLPSLGYQIPIRTSLPNRNSVIMRSYHLSLPTEE